MITLEQFSADPQNLKNLKDIELSEDFLSFVLGSPEHLQAVLKLGQSADSLTADIQEFIAIMPITQMTLEQHQLIALITPAEYKTESLNNSEIIDFWEENSANASELNKFLTANHGSVSKLARNFVHLLDTAEQKYAYCLLFSVLESKTAKMSSESREDYRGEVMSQISQHMSQRHIYTSEQQAQLNSVVMQASFGSEFTLPVVNHLAQLRMSQNNLQALKTAEKIQIFLDNPEKFDTALVRLMVRHTAHLNSAKFDLPEQTQKANLCNLWAFIFSSELHLKALIQHLESAEKENDNLKMQRNNKRDFKEQLKTFKAEISFHSERSMNVFEFVGSTNLYDLSVNQNFFMHQITPESYDTKFTNQEFIDFWGSTIDKTASSELDKCFEGDFDIQRFSDTYTQQMAGRNQIYLLGRLSRWCEEKFNEGSNERLEFTKALVPIVQDVNSIITAVGGHLGKRNFSITSNDLQAMNVGIIYVKNFKAADYLMKNQIAVEKERLTILLEAAPMAKKVNKL